MAYHQAGPVMQPGVWNSNSNYGNGSNCNSWANSVQTPSATVHPVRQTFDVIARRRNPHYWTAGNSNNPAVSSPGSGNSPLTPTPTPSPATPSPISPAYPNRPVSVDDAIHREPFSSISTNSLTHKSIFFFLSLSFSPKQYGSENMDFPQDSPRYTSPKPGGGLYGDSYFMGKMMGCIPVGTTTTTWWWDCQRDAPWMTWRERNEAMTEFKVVHAWRVTNKGRSADEGAPIGSSAGGQLLGGATTCLGPLFSRIHGSEIPVDSLFLFIRLSKGEIFIPGWWIGWGILFGAFRHVPLTK